MIEEENTVCCCEMFELGPNSVVYIGFKFCSIRLTVGKHIVIECGLWWKLNI